MGDDDEFSSRSYPDSELYGGDLDLRAAIANQNRAQRQAGMREGDAPRPSRGRPERVERRLDAIDNNFRLITRMMGQTGAEHSDDIRRLARILDSNGDGRVSDGELRDASGNRELLDEVKKISPLIARTLKDPNFRIRQIKRKDIGVLPARRHEINNQVETIRQGFGGYVEDVNMFNVDRI